MVTALRALDVECAKRGIAGEICIYGGAEMVLVFDARTGTRGVDAIFRPKSEIMNAAYAIAQEVGLPTDWLNDSVKGFISHNEKVNYEPIVAELEGLTHLRITWPTAEYLLAMKCLAARSEETSQDRQDVEFLIRALRLTTKQAVLEIVEQFYPADRIHVRTRYFVEEIIADMKQKPNSE